MADVNANIGVGIETSGALAQLKNLQRQIAQFHSSVAKSSETAAIAQRDLQKNFLNSVNAIEGFSAELRTVKTTAESFTSSLEKNKLSVREYFRYAAGATKTFGKSFRSEFDVIEKTAIERVKTLQTQYIKMGRDAQGAMQAIAIRPTILNMEDLGTKTMIAGQKQAIFNQLVKQGSTQLLNFGKNTQWAGRQLMVGFTLPLATLGMTAGKTFMEMEQAVLKFRKVYGDLFTSQAETDQALKGIQDLAQGYTQYGIAVADTVGLAAEAAAAGFQGVDLQNQTSAATKLAVLGQIEQSKALETTIALQNAFKTSTAELAGQIDFLNAVENQTVVSLDDITTAIPKVAPVIQQLGGDVKDLAFFLAAMKEGGINASEGANALKSGLGALINPTTKASQMLSGFGINIRDIVSRNQGDLKSTIVEFAEALDTLAPLDRARAIEQLFGKFQFARLSTLFQNVSKDGTQASRVLELAGSSIAELSALSDKELGQTAASSMMKFKKAIEDIKVALVPLGQMFLEIATPFVEFGSQMLDAFNNLPDGIKKAIGTAVAVIGGLGPVLLMTFGLINNGIANMIKFFATVRLGYLKITGQAQEIGSETQYMTTEQLNAAAAAASLDQAHSNLTQRFTAEKTAVEQLTAAYINAVAAGNRFAAINPGMMKPGTAARNMATGGMVRGPGSGTSDSIPANLSNGEAVIDAETVKKNPSIIAALFAGKKIEIPGFAKNNSPMFGFDAPGKTQTGADITAFAHIGESVATTVEKLVSSLTASGKTVKKDLADLQKAGLGGSKARAYGGLGFNTTQTLNDQMGKAGANPAEFLKDFDTRGLSKWSTSLNIAGLKQEDVADDLKVFDQKIRNAVKSASDLDAGFKVTDKFIKQIADETFKELDANGSKLSEGFKKAAKITTEYRTQPTKGEMIEQGFKEDPSRPDNKKYMVSPEGMQVKAGRGAKKIARTASGLGIDLAELEQSGEAIVKQEAKAVTDGVKKATRQASPSKEAYDAGENIGKGAINGIKSTTNEAEAAGMAVGAGTQAGRNSRRSGTGGVIKYDERSKQYVNQEKMAKLELGRQAGLVKASEMNMDAIKGMTNKLMGASFALSTITGVATMFGGKVGEAAGAIMNVTNLMFALATVTSLLTKNKLAEAAVSGATGALSMLPGRGIMGRLGGGAKAAASAAGGGLGGLKAGAGVVKGNIGKVLSGAVAGMTKLVPAIGSVVGGLIKFIPVIGWVVTAFTVGLEVFNRSRDAVNGLGAAANLSAEKLAKIGDIVGQKTKDAGFGSAFTASVGSNKGEQRDLTKQVREAEGFKDDFKLEIDAIKGAAKSDAERVLNALAIQLSGSGLDEQATQAVINAISEEAGRTDLKLEFASVQSSSKQGLVNISKIAADTAAALNNSFKNINIWDNLFGGMGGGQFKAQIQTTAGEFSSLLSAIKLDFENGEIGADQFNAKLEDISGRIESLDPRAIADLMPAITEKLLSGDANKRIRDQIKSLKSWKDQLILIKAATAGVKIPQNAVDLLQKASKAGADKKTLEAANKLRKQLVELTKQSAAAINEETAAKAAGAQQDADIQAAIESMQAETKGLEDQATAYKTLVDLGYDQATAYNIATNSMYATAIAAAQAADAIAGTNSNVVAVMENLNALLKAKNAAPVAASGGGGQKDNPYKDAMVQLGKQRTEIKNTIAAYSGLRKAGFGAAEAAQLAADATIAAGLASKKVGSKEWQALVNQIKLARLEALKTAEGIRDAFSGLSGLADQYFDILERQIDRKYQTSIEGQEKAINDLNDAIADVSETMDGYQSQIDTIQNNMEVGFDRPIQALQDEASQLSNDLTIMDHAADEITKRYDEQAKALSDVAKVNQQIINQQKQQMGIADALASGDISAAANAIQDLRASNAAAAATSQEEALTAAKDAQIGALRSGKGMSRDQIEKRQYEIGQQVYGLEQKKAVEAKKIQVLEDLIYKTKVQQLDPLKKNLLTAEKALKATEDQKKAETDAVKAQRQKWSDAQLALDLAKIAAGDFNSVIDMTSKLTGDVVKDWKSLASKAITLTINTVKKEIGAIKTPAKAAGVTKDTSGGGGGGKSTIPTVPKDNAALAESFGDALKRANIDPYAWLGDVDTKLNDWWGDVGAWFGDLGNKIAAAAGDIWKGIQGIPAWLGEQWAKFQVWLGELPYNLGFAAGQLWGHLQNIGDWLATQWTNFQTWWDTKLIPGITQWGKDVWTNIQNIPTWLQTQWVAFQTWLTVTLPNGIKQWGKDLWKSIQNVGEWLSTQWTNFKTWLTVTLPNGIKTWAVNLWTKGLPAMGAWLGTKADEIRQWLVSLPSKITTWASGLWNGFWSDFWSGFSAGESKTKNKNHTGGTIHRAFGGDVPGNGNTDSVSAMLTPGEYVVNKTAAAKFRPVLKAINSGTFGGGLDSGRYKAKPQMFAPRDFGGVVSASMPKSYAPRDFNAPVYNTPDPGLPKSQNQGPVFGSAGQSSAPIDNSVYNYNLSVNVEGSNSSADQIATVVMGKLRGMKSQQIRGQVV